MTAEILIVFGVTIAGLVAFISGRFPVDLVALGIPALLLITGVIGPEAAVAGLGNPATVTVGAMLAMSLGLAKTGAIATISGWVRRDGFGGTTPRLFLTCLIAASISPFLNNTAVVVVFIPVCLELARSRGVPPSLLLIPLSFSAILGGTVTLLGTSTNLIVYGMAESRGYDELGMFSIAPVGLIYLAVGLTYLFTIGRALLPARDVPGDLAQRYGLRDFITEMRVEPSSPVVGRTLGDLGWGDRYGVQILGIERGEVNIPAPGARRLIQAGDLLYGQGPSKALVLLAREQGLGLPAEDARERREIRLGEGRMVEVLVTPGSSIEGRTLRDARFVQTFEAVVLAIRHLGVNLPGRLPDRRIENGDILLVHGPERALHALAGERGFVVLGEVPGPGARRPGAGPAVAILAAVVLAAGIAGVPIVTAALLGVGLMVLTRCVTLREIYAELDWSLIFLLAGLIPLGIAMDETGAALWIGQGVARVAGPYGPVIVVAAFYLVTSLLTEAMSNNAAAVVLTPIALITAADLGMNPYALLVAVMFGASASFMTPIGYQTNTLIYGPGGYRFSDFVRVGAPLNLLLLVTAAITIPRFWPS